MDIYEVIKKRRSIRRFKQDEIPLGILEKLVDAARFAPSGGNIQPWEFIIVNDKELLDKVFETLAWAGYIAPEGTPPEGKRPTAYICLLYTSDAADEGLVLVLGGRRILKIKYLCCQS